MLRKIYQELVAIRKELQAINKSMENLPRITFDRKPYENSYRASLRPPDKDR